MKLRLVFTLVLASLSASAMAATDSTTQTNNTDTASGTHPFQLSLPNKNVPEGNVNGGRVALFYGRTDKVTGANLTLFGLSDVNEFKGAELGFFGVNRNRVDMQGAQFGLVNWNDNTATGASIGLVNYTGGTYTGAQLGLVNFNKGPMIGAQFGFANYAGNLTGLQFGLVNATNRIDEGVQIGLINFDKSGTFVSKDVPVFPIINARF
ncbi:hypothetical protein M9194_07015 [Vibrio sp. S4M6]|uniref:LA_2272 family surface repeat-containing protein n=1 Tax=Vibrio sinus TaxID=2946865 RepID=UPI00202A8BEC|nr:hypothetical protein [Vibrio sinus]MCL9781176.1 hypothetical protein [Vibrio sinus]